MTTLDVFTDEAVSTKVFNSVGMVRIPFGVLSSSIYDLIRAYARGFLSAEDFCDILNCDLGEDCDTSKYDNVSFYMYSSKTYEECIKMIIKEHYSDEDGFEDTLSATMLFCSDDEVDYDFDTLPLITEDNQEDVVNYSSIVPKDALFIIQVDTMIKHFDYPPSTISEYILYIPYI